MLLFLASFFLVYGGMHWYGYRKISAAIPLDHRARRLLVAALVFLASAPILVRMAERTGYVTVAATIAWFGYLWMGFLFLFVVIAGAVDLVRSGWRLAGWLARRPAVGLPARWGGLPFWLACPLALLLCGYGWQEAKDVQLTRVVIPSAKLPVSAAPLRIVQISDLHLGLLVGRQRLERMLAQVRAARPDVLVVTGDLVDAQADGLVMLADRFRTIAPRYGKYAVTGNHEYYVGIDQSLAFAKAAGFTVLQGQTVRVGDHGAIAGVDDPVGVAMGRAAADEEQRVAAAQDRSRFAILLKHRPEVTPASARVFDLQLSGHVHGGQIAPFNLLTWLAYPVPTGLTKSAAGALLYVSRGSGTWGPPLRLLSPPEVTLIEVVPATITARSWSSTAGP